MAYAFMASVEILRISRQQPAHVERQSDGSAFEQDMCMVRHQSKCVDACPRCFRQQTHTAKKFHSVAIVAYDTTLFNSPHHYMMQRSRCVKSRSSWHMALLSFAFQKLPAHIFCFLTELQNTFFYAIALRPL